MADFLPEIHIIFFIEVQCLSVNAKTLSSVVTFTKLKYVAIVRTLTTDGSALMFVYDCYMCQQSKLVHRFILPSISTIMSSYVGTVIIDLDKIENDRVAVANSAIRHPIPQTQCTSGLQSAILTSGSWLTTCRVRH
jgi:hypothetical protein